MDVSAVTPAPQTGQKRLESSVESNPESAGGVARGEPQQKQGDPALSLLTQAARESCGGWAKDFGACLTTASVM
jgi:hypothetical protein